MSELPTVTAEYFQILVVRELRKAGFDVGEVRVSRRTELPEPQQGFILELAVALARADWPKRMLVACRRQEHPVGREIVDDLKARLADARADVGILVATSGYDAEAVAAAQQDRIALLRVINARERYDGSGYGTPGHYPSWLPAHTVEVVDADTAGQTRARLLEPGGAAIVLAAFGTH
jgi:hypothetical protein